MLAMASSRCPNRSTAMKNTNQVAMERKYCTMVKHDMLKMRPSSAEFHCGHRFSPYFFKSTYSQVYITPKKNEAASAITDAMAAPFNPIPGKPKCPNIKA